MRLICVAVAFVVMTPLVVRGQTSFPLAQCAPTPTDSAAYTRTSFYIPMTDGVRLAADAWLPANAATHNLPTILQQTRYWRSTEGGPPTIEQRFWLRRGYAVISVDVRGTGASFGTWPYPAGPNEIKDMGTVTSWITSQPWSNGRIATTGGSYTANTAENAALSGAPAVKAVFSKSSDFDMYTDLLFPGGVPVHWLSHAWGDAVHAMDFMDRSAKRGNPPRGVRPVDGADGPGLLEAAVREHASNPHFSIATDSVVYRDDAPAIWGATMRDFSAYNYRAQFERTKVPLYAMTGWFDAGTADGALKRFLTFDTPQHVVLGPWSHGAAHDADPYKPIDTPPDPTTAAQLQEAACFIEPLLGDVGTPPAREIVYYTVGANTWNRTPTWPPAGVAPVRWYAGAKHVLSRDRPRRTGRDRYRIDFTATTGDHNRWHTQTGGGDVYYANRAQEDVKLLTYTSAPLMVDMEITGNPVITLNVASTASDGAFFVYLEDVAPTGEVALLSEGEMRALHRKISTDKPPYRMVGPYHSFARKDGEPLTPGETTEIRFGLLPISALIRKGHRLRIAIAGADADTFSRIPEFGVPTITVFRSNLTPSYIELPVAPVR
jgi:putative CocE/NonD family hydrolase